MILTNIDSCKYIIEGHESLKRLIDYVKSHDMMNAPLGRIELDENADVFINVVEPECVAREKQVLEMHREYVDVHILLRGEETIGWKHIDHITTYSQEYKEEGDCALSPELADNYYKLLPGDVFIVFPEDPHAPVIGEGKIRKLIGKIRVSKY